MKQNIFGAKNRNNTAERSNGKIRLKIDYKELKASGQNTSKFIKSNIQESFKLEGTRP